MVIDDPDQLHRYLSVLRDAGVRRAKLGDVEVEFEDNSPEVVAQLAEDRMFEVPRTAQPARATNVPADKHPGYSALFGENTPKFKPAGEG